MKTNRMNQINQINQIICGNALKELSKINSNSVNLVITSPPYFKQRNYTNGNEEEIGVENSMDDYIHNLHCVFKECVRVLMEDGSIVWNMGDLYLDKCLQLLPYRFAISILDQYSQMILINDITWVKSNPTPRQYSRRLISATEPFFHFVKSNNYYYDKDSFLDNQDVKEKSVSMNNYRRFCKKGKKGKKYKELISKSNLSDKEKINANNALNNTLNELKEEKITDFRMKIRGVHKKAFGGQQGGRNSQIDKQGYTIIRMYGKKIKRDIIESAVANTKNIDHPAVFPLTVIKELVKLLSKEGNLVLDPFCGSGQTCLVSKLLNRNYLGIELNPEYYKIAKERLL
jgi:DNA modification methylase